MASGGAEKRLEEHTVEVCACKNKSLSLVFIKNCSIYSPVKSMLGNCFSFCWKRLYTYWVFPILVTEIIGSFWPPLFIVGPHLLFQCLECHSSSWNWFFFCCCCCFFPQFQGYFIYWTRMLCPNKFVMLKNGGFWRVGPRVKKKKKERKRKPLKFCRIHLEFKTLLP